MLNCVVVIRCPTSFWRIPCAFSGLHYRSANYSVYPDISPSLFLSLFPLAVSLFHSTVKYRFMIWLYKFLRLIESQRKLEVSISRNCPWSWDFSRIQVMIPSHDPSRFVVVVSDISGAQSLESFPARERYKCLASKRRFKLNIYGWSPKLSQFNWKILSSTYPCCRSLHCTKRG